MKIKRYFTLRLVLFHDTGVAYLSVNVSTVHKYLSGRTFTHVSMWICFFSSFLRWGQGYGNTLRFTYPSIEKGTFAIDIGNNDE